MTTQAWSVTDADGATTWFDSRAQADSFALSHGITANVRPTRAPAYAQSRFGIALSPDRRSENLARGLKEAFGAVEDGQAFEVLWVLEIVADAVRQCGFADDATLTMSRPMFEACYEKLATIPGLTVPDVLSLPDKPTELGELYGLRLLVAKLEPTPQIAYTDADSGERFVSNLPSIAGQTPTP
jgi:hypothetical protein